MQKSKMEERGGGAKTSKVIRAPNLKRGRDDIPMSQKVKLERVLGLTVSCNAGLTSDPLSGLIAYPAGCTAVLLNARKNRQSHILNVCRKTITSLRFSPDGHYLATGECGHSPHVRLWDLTRDGIQVAEFPGHKYAVNCVAFSPNMKYIVSVGSQHDMIVNVWDWKSNIKVASNKVSTKVKAISFADNGSYFVTVGNRHVKFWYLEYSRSAKYKDPVPLMGRSAILGEQRNNYFCDVGCGQGEMGDSTYAITRSGLLCEFNNRRLLDKWVELRTTSANCMVVGEELIFIGCAQGIVRCFNPFTLQFVTTLPRTHFLGVDVAKGLSISHMASHPPAAKYPDTVAITYDEGNHKVTCVYNDHSLYVWDVRNVKRVGKSQSYMYHSACIWGVEIVPQSSTSLPEGSFVTCSSDDTIRLWNVPDANNPQPIPETLPIQRNVYSTDLLKALYVDPELLYLKEMESSGTSTGTSTSNNNNGTTMGGSNTESSYDGCNGVRCIRICPDGLQLASGDRAGNIRIHTLPHLQEVCKIEAHDAEVLCLEYTGTDCSHRLLASASRDRLIHVFNVDNDYDFLQTVDDHSSSITAVRFIQMHGPMQMVSCGADKCIIFRQLNKSTTVPGKESFILNQQVMSKSTLYDMELDVSQKHILAACQDRSVRVYNISTGKHSRTFKGALGDDGSLIKVVLDGSGLYLATSCTDKTIHIYDWHTGECVASMLGHSELVTGLRFTLDSKHLISVSGDGCVFIWSLPSEMTAAMKSRKAHRLARKQQKESRRGTFTISQSNNNNNMNNMEDNINSEKFGKLPIELLMDPNANAIIEDDLPDYRFSVGQLPTWAKKQIIEGSNQSTTQSKSDYPKGRWAQRVDPKSAGRSGITVRTFYDNDSIIPFPVPSGDDSSKDSSVESSAESRNITPFEPPTQAPVVYVNQRRRHLTDDSSVSGGFRFEDVESCAHDGDVEDESEMDGESTDAERMLYCPPAEDTGSDFTVTAMDAEELRRSQNRHKKSRAERPTDIPTLLVAGSQESDYDDDDQASTPSAETAEKNLMSMLSISNESLDRVSQRERFLKSTFDSLSGAENNDDDMMHNKNTISAQFLTGRSRNVEVIEAVRETQRNMDATKTREELNRRVEETRRKLRSIGHRFTMHSSRSVVDLSNIPEKDTSGPFRACDMDSDNSGPIRRACSLSDLSSITPRRTLPNPPSNVSGKKVPVAPPGWATPRRGSTGPLSLPRSSSVGFLMQSDSESDASVVSKSLSTVSLSRATSSSLLRPTISSQNKMLNPKSSSSNVHSRRRSLTMAYSTGDLRKADDSSSEETSPPENKGRKGSRELSRAAREVTQRLTSNSSKSRGPLKSDLFVNRSSVPPPVPPKNRINPPPVPPRRRDSGSSEIVSSTAGEVSASQCDEAASILRSACDRVVLLHRRVTQGDLPESHCQRLQLTLTSCATHVITALKPIIANTSEESIINKRTNINTINNNDNRS